MLSPPIQNKPFFHCSLHPDTAGMPHGDADQVTTCLLMEEGQTDLDFCRIYRQYGDNTREKTDKNCFWPAQSCSQQEILQSQEKFSESTQTCSSQRPLHSPICPSRQLEWNLSVEHAQTHAPSPCMLCSNMSKHADSDTDREQ